MEKSPISRLQVKILRQKKEAVYGSELQKLYGQLGEKIFRLLGQLEKKYFDYFVNYGLICSGARRRALAQTIVNARGLDINSPLSAENHPQDLQFRRHHQRDDPNNARGLDNNFASDRGYDSTTSTRRPLRPRLRSAASTTSASTSTTSSSTMPRRPRRTR
jgi:hypothetical protein